MLGKEEAKLLLANNVLIINPNESTDKIFELQQVFRKFAKYKISIKINCHLYYQKPGNETQKCHLQ